MLSRLASESSSVFQHLAANKHIYWNSVAHSISVYLWVFLGGKDLRSPPQKPMRSLQTCFSRNKGVRVRMEIYKPSIIIAITHPAFAMAMGYDYHSTFHQHNMTLHFHQLEQSMKSTVWISWIWYVSSEQLSYRCTWIVAAKASRSDFLDLPLQLWSKFSAKPNTYAQCLYSSFPTVMEPVS